MFAMHGSYCGKAVWVWVVCVTRAHVSQDSVRAVLFLPPFYP